MSRRKAFPHILGCASILALSLTTTGCSHHAGKLKGETNLKENVPPESTSSTQNAPVLHVGKKSARAKKTAGSSKISAYDNLWDRLFDLYDLPRVEREEINRELEWFVNHPTYIDRVQSRAEPFLYSIVRQVEKHEIPGEIALLPVIESAFQPHAISPAHAAGIWQFIPSTGRLYGLKKSRSYDGRRDVYASTRAAIKYLKKLHNDFNGDWLLAIAAYNCGEGAVARAIHKNEARSLPTDFWSLDLPRETRTYVPRLLAVARVFADSGQYGIDLRHIPNKALFKTVTVKSQLDLALAADAADVSLDKMLELNPGFKRPITDLDGSYRLFVPADKYRSFKEALPRLVEAGVNHDDHTGKFLPDELVAAADHSFAEGLNRHLSKAHDAHGMEKDQADKLAAAPGKPTTRFRTIDKSDKVVRVHDRIPGAGLEKISGGSLVKASYTVQGGDTLYSIARKNGVGVDQLRQWNRISEKTAIRSGQDLVVWNGDAVAKLPIAGAGAGIKASQSIRYTVKPGDSLFAISRRFNVTVADLRKWNGAQLDKKFKPGMNLTVSGGD